VSPSDADSGQRRLFRAYLKSRSAIYAYVFGGSAAFLVGAWQRDPWIMATGPPAVVLMVAGIAAWRADRDAADRFWRAFSDSLGLACWPGFELLPLTPLLGAGDRRRCGPWLQGTLPGEPAFQGGLGHFVFEEVDDRRVSERRRFTLCAIELEPSLAVFKGVYVRHRRGLFPEGRDWLRKGGTRTLELESAAFQQRYEVRIAGDQDELLARQLLAPSLVSWLATHPLRPCFELKAGTLAVYLPRPLDDAGNLSFFLDGARHIAARVLRETDEAVARPAA
jgi:hypothetical protein